MRLFVAISPSKSFKEKAADMLLELSLLPVKVKWVVPENIHLTLKFLGEVDPERLEEICAAIRSACQEVGPLLLDIRGAGVFPNWRSPRIIWIGIDDNPALKKLQQNLARECALLGFPADKRFTPHLTVGRLRAGASAGVLRAKLQKMAGFYWGAEKIDKVSLMESRLTPRGAVYSSVLTFDLKG